MQARSASARRRRSSVPSVRYARRCPSARAARRGTRPELRFDARDAGERARNACVRGSIVGDVEGHESARQRQPVPGRGRSSVVHPDVRHSLSGEVDPERDLFFLRSSEPGAVHRVLDLHRDRVRVLRCACVIASRGQYEPDLRSPSEQTGSRIEGRRWIRCCGWRGAQTLVARYSSGCADDTKIGRRAVCSKPERDADLFAPAEHIRSQLVARGCGDPAEIEVDCFVGLVAVAGAPDAHAITASRAAPERMGTSLWLTAILRAARSLAGCFPRAPAGGAQASSLEAGPGRDRSAWTILGVPRRWVASRSPRWARAGGDPEGMPEGRRSTH